MLHGLNSIWWRCTTRFRVRPSLVAADPISNLTMERDVEVKQLSCGSLTL
jgi:hypothetical protein